MRSRTLWIAVFGGIVALGVRGGGGRRVRDGQRRAVGIEHLGPRVVGFGHVRPPDRAAEEHACPGQASADLLVGLAARPGGPVEVAAVRGDTPVASDAVRVSVDGRDVPTESCGTGCSRAQVAVLQGRPSRVTVSAGSVPVSFQLPGLLPASGESAFDRARRTMAALRSYRFTERLTSGGGVVFYAPGGSGARPAQPADNSGFRSVIIGHKRWDYQRRALAGGPVPRARGPWSS